MYYLNLRVPIFEGGRDKVLRISEKEKDCLLRDSVANSLYSIITSEKNNAKNALDQTPFRAKIFTFEDHKQLYKFKEKILYLDDEIIQISNNLFEFIEKNFKPDICDASMNTLVVVLSEMIEKAKNPEGGEEQAERDFKQYQAKNPKSVTVKKFYEDLGYKVEIEPVLRGNVDVS